MCVVTMQVIIMWIQIVCFIVIQSSDKVCYQNTISIGMRERVYIHVEMLVLYESVLSSFSPNSMKRDSFINQMRLGIHIHKQTVSRSR